MIYTVGPDNRGLFRSQRTTWEFEDALDQAEDGDEIVIKKDYVMPGEEKNYIIGANITIRGENYSNDSSQLPTIRGGLFVNNGIHLVIKNLNICRYLDKHNSLSVKDGGYLTAENVFLYNFAKHDENYPIIYISNNSNVNLNQVYIALSNIKDGGHKIYVSSSDLVINNSKINSQIYIDDSSMECYSSTVEYHDSNVLSIKDGSNVILKDTSLIGGKVEKDFPCLWIANSSIQATDTSVIEPSYNGALCLKNKASGKFHSCYLDSISLWDASKASLNQTCRIGESIQLDSDCKLTGDTILVDGYNNGKINLYANKNAMIKADWIGFGQESNLNIRLSRNAVFDVSNFYLLKFDVQNKQYILNDKNQYLIEKQYQKQDIDFFPKINMPKKKEKAKMKDHPSAVKELDEMIGLNNVKRQIKEFVSVAVLNKKREERGLSTSSQTLHSLFLGNPGTGKTTVARIVGHILYDNGVIAEDKLIETSRADLVAGYIGQTAVKTRKVLESALGGILFIDEAYTLANGGQNDFGQEAIDEILKFMEDNRSNIMIIFAGYTKNMESFLETNPGLRSRIPNEFNFEDYTVDEMIQIGLLSLKKKQYNVNPTSYAKLLKNNYTKDNDDSNGRWVRNLNDEIIKKQALRLAARGSCSNDELVNITEADLDAVKI